MLILQLLLSLVLFLLAEDHLCAWVSMRLMELVWVGVTALTERLLGYSVCISGDVALIHLIPLGIPEPLVFWVGFAVELIIAPQDLQVRLP